MRGGEHTVLGRGYLDHPAGQQSVELVSQHLRVRLSAAAALDQHAGNPVGEEVQGHEQVPVAQGGVHGSVPVEVLQVAAEISVDDIFHLLPLPGAEQVVDECPVLHGKINKKPEGGFRVLRLQAASEEFVRASLHDPLNDIQYILEMIIEGLAGDAALLHQVFYRDLIKALPGGHRKKGLCNLFFYVLSQNPASCPAPVCVPPRQSAPRGSVLCP